MNNNTATFRHIQDCVQSGKKLFAVLIDPDKSDEAHCKRLCASPNVDLFLVGGSLLSKNTTRETIAHLKANSDKPVLIFPGNAMQVEDNADALLFLSLISGRNPDMLIGQHVSVAPLLKSMDIDVIPTGYMLIDSGKPTAALYMSQTLPIPADKPEIACATALAGEYLGLKAIYMDGGSGAHQHINYKTIRAVRDSLNPSTPLFVGGGIDSIEKISNAFQHGADIVVVGNKLEDDPDFIHQIKDVTRIT